MDVVANVDSVGVFVVILLAWLLLWVWLLLCCVILVIIDVVDVNVLFTNSGGGGGSGFGGWWRVEGWVSWMLCCCWCHNSIRTVALNIHCLAFCAPPPASHSKMQSFAAWPFPTGAVPYRSSSFMMVVTWASQAKYKQYEG